MNHVDLLRATRATMATRKSNTFDRSIYEGELLRPGADAAQRTTLLAWRSEEPKILDNV